MIGSILNALGIIIGALVGWLAKKQLPPSGQHHIKLGLGAFTTFFGLHLVWESLNGSVAHIGKQFLTALLALIAGRLLGRLLRLQKISNRIGRFAGHHIAAANAGKKSRLSDAFNASTALFCAAPLGILGSVTDGLSENFFPLAVKAVMDSIAAMSFATMFGGGVALAALPVFVWQGTLTLLCLALSPWLLEHHLLDSVNTVAGLLIIFVALVIFEIRKIELADYLPSLAAAPLLTWLWK